MRFSCEYNILLPILQEVANVAEDSMTADADKNIIFRFAKTDSGNIVKVIGANSSTTYRKDIDAEHYTLELDDTDVDSTGVMFLQLKSKDLLAFLNSYKTVRRTVVKDVIFEPVKGKIKCTVTESPIYTDEELSLDPTLEDKVMFSQWLFAYAPISPNKLGLLNIDSPTEGLCTFSKQAFRLYSSCLLPVMENVNGLYGFMSFDDTYVVAFNKAYNTVMRNGLASTSVFTGIKIQYRLIDFISKVICGVDEDVEIARLDRYIYFKTASSELFVVYDTKLAPYQNILDLVKKESYVKLDRIYLKDVLKRLSLNNDSVEVCIKPAQGVVTLSNSCFSQDIALTGQYGMDNYENVRFKIMPDILTKAIIGNDDTFLSDDEDSANTYIYYTQVNEKRYSITFSDKSGYWMSVVAIKPY